MKSQIHIKKPKLVDNNDIIKMYPFVELNPNSQFQPEYKSKWQTDRIKKFIISNRYPALKKAFRKKGWEDGEDEMLEDENYKFDFSYYNFN